MCRVHSEFGHCMKTVFAQSYGNTTWSLVCISICAKIFGASVYKICLKVCWSKFSPIQTVGNIFYLQFSPSILVSIKGQLGFSMPLFSHTCTCRGPCRLSTVWDAALLAWRIKMKRRKISETWVFRCQVIWHSTPILLTICLTVAQLCCCWGWVIITIWILDVIRHILLSQLCNW